MLIYDSASSSYFLFLNIANQGSAYLPDPLQLITNVSVNSFSFNYADIFDIISDGNIIYALGSPGYVLKNGFTTADSCFQMSW